MKTMKKEERCTIKYTFILLFEKSTLNCGTKDKGANGSNSCQMEFFNFSIVTLCMCKRPDWKKNML